MKRVARFVLVCACLLVPIEARANDGGWWDWLWKWDAKFMGVGSEIHLLCLDATGNRLPRCEQWFKNVGRAMIGRQIQHYVPAEAISIRSIFDSATTGTTALATPRRMNRPKGSSAR